MNIDNKLLAAINSAYNYLENSVNALNNGDEDSFANSLWHVVAELEYALFLFSITLQNDAVSKPKAYLNPKKVEVRQILSDANRFLKDAEIFVKNGKILEAYENVYGVRNYALKIQKELLKRRREALKRNSGK